MPAHFIALSDLHLGYDNSCLTDPKTHANLAAALADLCGGETDRLVLNGDAFEGCVPRDAGTYDPAGHNPVMAACARSFFSALLDRIDIQSLIIVWGNHDYAMWRRLASACGVSTFTNSTRGDLLLQHDGSDLPGAAGFLNDVVGPARSKLARVRSAYPNYVLGRYWPYLVFHHGHFLDDLVIGQDEDAKYLGLRVLTGAGHPGVNVHGDETVKSLHDKTEAFISATWEYNSRAREVEWAMIAASRTSHRTAPTTRLLIRQPPCWYLPRSPSARPRASTSSGTPTSSWPTTPLHRRSETRPTRRTSSSATTTGEGSPTSRPWTTVPGKS